MVNYIITLALRHFIKLGSCSTTRRQNKLSYVAVSLNLNQQIQQFLHYLYPFLIVFLTQSLIQHFQQFPTLFLLKQSDRQNKTKTIPYIRFLNYSVQDRFASLLKAIMFSSLQFPILPTIKIYQQSFMSLQIHLHLITSSHQHDFRPYLLFLLATSHITSS